MPCTRLESGWANSPHIQGPRSILLMVIIPLSKYRYGAIPYGSICLRNRPCRWDIAFLRLDVELSIFLIPAPVESLEMEETSSIYRRVRLNLINYPSVSFLPVVNYKRIPYYMSTRL